MSEFRNKLRQTQEYQALAGQQQPQAPTDTRQVESVTEAVDPVVSLEKSDVQFWLQVVQLVVLLLILRELRGGF